MHVYEIGIEKDWIEIAGSRLDEPFRERLHIKECLMTIEGGGKSRNPRYALLIKHNKKTYYINYDGQWNEMVFLDFYRKFRDQRRDGLMDILYDSDLKFIENRLLGMSFWDAQNTK